MKHHKKGFTIIEVVLVLAIGGLIFAMAFIALPALQRSQRNAQKRRDAERVYAAVEKYFANNGKMPYTTTKRSGLTNVVNVELDGDFVPRYIDNNCVLAQNSNGSNKYYTECSDEFTSPLGNTYRLCTHTTSTASWGSSYAYGPCFSGDFSDFNDSVIEILPYSNCNYSKDRYKLNKFAIRVMLEGGATYCLDNS